MDDRAVRGPGARWPRVGLAIGIDLIVVACRDPWRRSITALERPLRTGPGVDGTWPDLEEALRSLMEELDVRGASVDIALLPPLAFAKSIRTPPVASGQLDALVTRNLRRYFLTPFTAPFGRACPMESRGRRVERALAACSDERLVESICRSAEDAGLALGSVTAGPVALGAGISAYLPRHASSVVGWTTPLWSGGMVLVGGRPQHMECWGRPADDEVRTRVSEMAAEAEAGDIVILDGGDLRDAGSSGSSGARGHDAEATLLDPLILTAMGATHRGHARPSLISPLRFAAFRTKARRRAQGLAAAAAVLLTMASGIHGVGLARELAALEDGRQSIEGSVARALELRRGAYAVEDRLSGIGQMEEDVARWTPALAALTEVLPRTAYLVSLSTDGLTLQLGGVSTESESIVPKLQASPYFGDVTLTNVRAADVADVAEATQFDLSMALPGPHPGGEMPR